MTFWGLRIARKLAVSGIIDPDETDLYAYGFFLLLSRGIYLLVTSIFGAVFGILWENVLFYVSFSLLREYAGGIHAKTEPGCILCSILVILLSSCGIYCMDRSCCFWVAIALLTVGCSVTFLFCPLDVSEKRLSVEERQHYRRVSRILVAVYWLLGIVTARIHCPVLYPITIATIAESILLMAAAGQKL